MTLRLLFLAVCLVIVASGCVSARATYEPATKRVTLDYRRLGDIEMECTATPHPDGSVAITVKSVSQAAALNTAMSTLAELAKRGVTP